MEEASMSQGMRVASKIKKREIFSPKASRKEHNSVCTLILA
jgi:hypothetical protein